MKITAPKMNKYTSSFLLLCLLGACTSSSIKDKINKVGDAAGQVAGEFAQGASKGISKAFDVKVEVPKALSAQGLEFGKNTVSNDSVGTDNLLLLYIIFHADFKGTLVAKAYDDQSLEMGRASANVIGKKSEAHFVEFHFDKRTNIDSKNRITIE
jgi:hypothetical protein